MGFDAQEKRQQERGGRLDTDRRRDDGEQQAQRETLLADDFVDEDFRGVRQNQTRDTTDGNQDQPEGDEPPPRKDEILDRSSDRRERRRLLSR